MGIFVLPAGKAGKRKAGIKAGDEILVSYGKGYWEARKTMATFRKDFEMRTQPKGKSCVERIGLANFQQSRSPMLLWKHKCRVILHSTRSS